MKRIACAVLVLTLAPIVALAPRVTAATCVAPTEISLWNNGTVLRGANVYQGRNFGDGGRAVRRRPLHAVGLRRPAGRRGELRPHLACGDLLGGPAVRRRPGCGRQPRCGHRHGANGRPLRGHRVPLGPRTERPRDRRPHEPEREAHDLDEPGRAGRVGADGQVRGRALPQRPDRRRPLGDGRAQCVLAARVHRPR